MVGNAGSGSVGVGLPRGRERELSGQEASAMGSKGPPPSVHSDKRLRLPWGLVLAFLEACSSFPIPGNSSSEKYFAL